ncbi:MAG TPA: Xaa-Pro aminopeptidase [Thermoanaerobaculia bacterium]|nr:Xaa-Pro aminopeptidase [Thermoanaerobaculia bacterium]
MKRAAIAILAVILASNVFATDAAEHAARRARLAKEIGPNGMLIVFSPRPATRNGDVTWPFRQGDNLLYLTGITQSDTTLILMPAESDFREVVFVTDRNPQTAIWGGGALTHDAITKISGIKRVESSSAFRPFVAAMLLGMPWRRGNDTERFPTRSAPSFYRAVLAGNAEIWLAHASRGSATQPLTDEQQFANDLRQRFPEARFRDAQPLIRAMREVKSPAEIVAMQRAIDITVAAQKAAMKRALTATNESQVDAVVAATYRDLGAESWGFPSIVAAGLNSTTLHYEENNAPVDRNGLMLTDLGAEIEGYSADVTRTYPANGRFTPAQRAIYEAVLAAQNAGIAAARAGARLKDIDNAATASLGRDLLRLGLIAKDDPKQVYLYFRHGVGHHLGLDVHDVWDVDGNLEPNMVVTVEPGVYVRRDDVVNSPEFTSLSNDEQDKIRAALDKYNGIGVRIEDDVLIADGAARVLSAGAPRSIADIEAFQASAR